MNGERGMTSPNSDWSLIIHADSAGTKIDVYWVDINAGREGLRLARQVKEWRRRSDLLTIGERIRIVNVNVATPEPMDDPPPPPDVPALAPVPPVETSRTADRREYLRGRVRAVLGHSEPARFALQRLWPAGVPGLKQDGHTWEQLEAIMPAIEKVEKDYSVPFYPEWNDPIEEAKREHPSSFSDRWAKPKRERDDSPEGDAVRLSIQEAMSQHPRRALLTRWVGEAIKGGVDHSIDSSALAHALYEFASVDAEVWPDDDLTVMLDASLRTMGYRGGLSDLGKFNPQHAPLLMSAGFAIAAGTAAILYNDDGTTELLTDVIAQPKYL